MEMNISQLILEDREKRYNYVLKLLGRYALPVVCGKLNYPGVNKNTIEANKAFQILRKKIKDSFRMKTIFSVELEGFDGRSILAVIDMLPIDIKGVTVGIEDGSEIGRIFDIDVYKGDGGSIGRDMLDMPPRKCIICGDDARICVRSRKHSFLDTIGKINEIINNYGD